MLKKIFTVLVVSAVFAAGAHAADNALKSFGNEVKQTNQALLEKKVDSAAQGNKDKIKQYKAQQKQEQDKYKSAIKAKKAELAEIKKNKQGLSEQQKAAKEAAVQKQIDELNKKNNAVKDSYNKKIEALKI